MLKSLKAAWAVLRNKDINAPEKPVKVKKRTKKEVDAHVTQLEIEKEAATKRGEPWVTIVDMEVDYNNIDNGAFELDWNDLFIAKLVRLGFQGKEDADLVDQWFTNVCRNVVLETYEQQQADPRERDLGDGRKEYR